MQRSLRWWLGMERDAKPLSSVAADVGVDLAEHRAHRREGLEPIRFGVGVGELIELDDIDLFDREPTDARRVGAPAGLDARGGPAAEGRPLGPVVDRVPETLLKKELSHVNS